MKTPFFFGTMRTRRRTTNAASTSRRQKEYAFFFSQLLYLSFLYIRVAASDRPGPGFLKGYVRRFAQKSHDHRGTPQVSAKSGTSLLLVYQKG